MSEFLRVGECPEINEVNFVGNPIQEMMMEADTWRSSVHKITLTERRINGGADRRTGGRRDGGTAGRREGRDGTNLFKTNLDLQVSKKIKSIKKLDGEPLLGDDDEDDDEEDEDD